MYDVRRQRTKGSPFANIPVPDFVDIILRQNERSDEAMYYLLHQRFEHMFRERYEACQYQLYDDYEDIIEDFFLYLREGRGNRLPYQSLRRIKKKEAFGTWLLNTFRNYLCSRVRAEENHYKLSENAVDEVSVSVITDEKKLAVVSQLIAYAHQVFYPRGRFIFLRSLLTMLNKQKALPDKEMAAALQMTHLSYRVMAHRMKHNLIWFRNRLFQGEQLRLDELHQMMAQYIYDDFSHLYPTLLNYYNQTIDTLKCGEAIKQLRHEYFEATGQILHESEFDNSTRITVKVFWNRLDRMLGY